MATPGATPCSLTRRVPSGPPEAISIATGTSIISFVRFAASGMPTIFQLSRDDLASLLHFLRPDADLAALQDAAPTKLRPQITEWLLINGLSTMHQFVRDENNEWTMPDKADCISCGRYKVGGTPKAPSQPIVEEPEPLYITEQKLTYHLPAMDIPYALTHNDNTIIRSKSHEDKVVVTYPTNNNIISARSDFYESTKSECCTDCGRCVCSPGHCPMRKKTTSWMELFSYLSCRRVVTQ